MAITESDYLHVHKSESSFLLLRSPTHFHLIRIDADLSESRMERLLRIYPCDTDQLHKLGVHFSAFKATNLRGIVITGYQAGDTLELWLGGDVREYQLGTDYSDEILSSFFSGYLITRRLPPKWEGLDTNLIRKITWSLNGISIACAAAFLFIARPYKLWSVLCILCQLTALVLTLVNPASFTLTDDSKKQKQSIHKGKGHLLLAYFAPAFALSLRTLIDFTFQNRGSIFFLLISLAVSTGIATVICVLSSWLHPKPRNICSESIAAIVLAVSLGFGTIGQLNYLLDFSYTDRHVVEVVDKELSRGTKSTTYYCTVLLPNGAYMDLTLSAGTYSNIGIGDNVIVTHHTGAFGIPFSTVETLPDTHEMG